MSLECVRCAVTLTLKELHWEEAPGYPLHLEGSPVFLRACVLGQLLHTPLLRPTFPLSLQHSLTFDRVLTNCTDPSLLKEVITGEHVGIELIQVSEDYEGGKILARFEAPADTFLFPEPPTKRGELRTLALGKSRKYKHCPHLTFTTSTSVTKVTVHTPFTASPSKPPPDHDVDVHGEVLKLPTKYNARASASKVGVTAHDKLRLLLSSYSEPHPQQAPETEKGRGQEGEKLKPPRGKIRFKPPSTHIAEMNHRGAKSGGRNLRSVTPTPTGLYQSSLGPHSWAVCPRRSFRKRSRGGGGQKSRPRSNSAPSVNLRHGPFQLLPPQQVRGTTTGPTVVEEHFGSPRMMCEKLRPFVAGKVDPNLLAKRDFCGQSPGRAVGHVEREIKERRGERLGRREKENRHMGQYQRVVSSGWEEREVREVVRNGWDGRSETLTQRYLREPSPPLTAAHVRARAVRDGELTCDCSSTATSDGGSGSTHISQASEEEGEEEEDEEEEEEEEEGQEEEEEEYSCGVASGESQERVTEDICFPRGSRSAGSPSSPPHPLPSSPLTTHTPHLVGSRLRRDLISKYLQHGNGRMETCSPGRMIENKLNLLIQECCECRHSAESLGKDDITEDNERLRASLLAEREDHLNRSARLIPDQSILVGLGGEGGQDYWSQRVAEFTGKPHRLVFHETIEKIYHRLYQNATNMH